MKLNNTPKMYKWVGHDYGDGTYTHPSMYTVSRELCFGKIIPDGFRRYWIEDGIGQLPIKVTKEDDGYYHINLIPDVEMRE